MRTHLEFQSPAFDPEPGEDEATNPGIFGKRLAEFLAVEFAALGYAKPNVFAEDHGWWVELENPDFPLALICSSYVTLQNWVVQIEPSKPFVRKWFKRIDTTAEVAKVADQLETVLTTSGSASQLRWWDDRESGRN